MQLWIRWENGLVQTNNLKIYRYPGYCYTIETTDAGRSCIIGKYKTKKRVIEILDEIQKCLEHSDYMIHSNSSAKKPNIRANQDLFVLCDDNMYQIQERPLIIYTMPKE